jgi:hypothetical protein
MKWHLSTEVPFFRIFELSALLRAQPRHGFDAHGATRRLLGICNRGNI